MIGSRRVQTSERYGADLVGGGTVLSWLLPF